MDPRGKRVGEVTGWNPEERSSVLVARCVAVAIGSAMLFSDAATPDHRYIPCRVEAVS
jgi:hypothetical protein